ncbi:hypothetical protein BDW22DRAFT_1358234 [Trametopsis cervina]|nr:hypothetical protein BDW22DRAFT_1358234 [Trametopsis cervina]
MSSAELIVSAVCVCNAHGHCSLNCDVVAGYPNIVVMREWSEQGHIVAGGSSHAVAMRPSLRANLLMAAGTFGNPSPLTPLAALVMVVCC